MLLSSLRLLLLTPILSAAGATSRLPTHRTASTTEQDAFYESLTLRPLPDGRLSVLFEFTTYFGSPASSSSSSISSPIPQSHHSLTPPALLLPLEQNNVSELTISFSTGWDQARTGISGSGHYETSGGGGEVRGWLYENQDDQDVSSGRTVEDRWGAVTHALGGLFCAGLGPTEAGENVRTFGENYPPVRGDTDNITHFLLSHPEAQLCTENLTPFLSLLPSKGQSGLSALLAQPGIIFAWASQAEGIEVIMPTASHHGRWQGWWEGIVDLRTLNGKGSGKRDFSIEKIFRKSVPRPFPEAGGSVIRLISDGAVVAEPSGSREVEERIDGILETVLEWDVLDERTLIGSDIAFRWDEDRFRHPRTITPPGLTTSRTIIDRLASDGTLRIAISNNDEIDREAVYSEIWPWWVKGWMSEVEVEVDDAKRPDLLESVSYNPSIPPRVSTTTTHFQLRLPAKSTVVLKIPFTKLTIKYTEHRPDAERGVELSSGVLTLLDLDVDQDSKGERSHRHDGDDEHVMSRSRSRNPLKSGRRRIYTNRILLDVPTPDFSMPYNVIIMSSTVMAVFFGLMQGSLTRKWGWVQIQPGADSTEAGAGAEAKDKGSLKEYGGVVVGSE
ncbi:hypothetical protein I317_05487 [Kwoniella heveanensis CBS 569]|nr:hypothetical protein I317_05487 [Kwoniella heveanensis CBS 569]